MNFESFLFNIEEKFLHLFGTPLPGLIGIVIAIAFFSLLILGLRKLKEKKNSLSFNVEDMSDIGDIVEVNLNLTRSFIEMREFEKAEECIKKAEETSPLTPEQKEKINDLKERLRRQENGQ